MDGGIGILICVNFFLNYDWEENVLIFFLVDKL